MAKCYAWRTPLSTWSQLLTATCARRADEHILPIDADNRVIAQDITARVNVPAYENSAVDGYAFAHASLDQASASTTLRLLGDAEFAGQEAGTTIAAGQAVQITTGAAMPPGTDTVCMFEDVLGQQADTLTLPSALKIGDNVRPKGEDFAAGEPILRPGMRFNPIQLAALIATGHGTAPLAVRPKVRILVCSTGDELGHKAGESVLDANGPMLTSFLKHRWQFDAALHTAVLPDDEAAVAAFFTEQPRSGMSLSPQGRSQPVIETSCAVAFSAQAGPSAIGGWRSSLAAPLRSAPWVKPFGLAYRATPLQRSSPCCSSPCPPCGWPMVSRPPPPMTANGFN